MTVVLCSGGEGLLLLTQPARAISMARAAASIGRLDFIAGVSPDSWAGNASGKGNQMKFKEPFRSGMKKHLVFIG